MTSVINNSNANSSLINTIDASASRMNPQVYSTKTIYPPHAMTYVKCEKNSGGVSNGGQFNFQLSKFGIVSQTLFSYTKVFTELSSLPAGDIFSTIRMVELLSSSKTVSILTAEDMKAMFSDLTQSQFNPIFESALKERAAALQHKFVVPLCFGIFQDINTQPNTSFLEPMQIRITWNTPKSFFTSASTTTASTYNAEPIQNIYLNIRYKNYTEESTAELLSENYAKPELNQLSTKWYDESTVSYAQKGAIGTLQTVQVDLDNSECVGDFFVIVQVDTDPATAIPALPLPVLSITLTGSGQELVKQSAEELRYARLCPDGWSVGSDESTNTTQLYNVAKIQTGVYDHTVMSNCFSLREINATRITIEFAATQSAAEMYNITVVQKVLAIYATSSATGRFSLALSN
jgi:hypothetical protein